VPDGSDVASASHVLGSEHRPGRKQQPDPVTVKEVLTYFVRHPHAADDLEGVARWRLRQAAIRTRVEETRMALQWLVGKGFLRELPATGSTTIFKVNPDAADAIHDFLGVDDPAPDPER
jgi:hypothetical protein